MGYCTNCGHELGQEGGVGRFCTNCGHPVASEPPDRPSTARFPLFADEVQEEAAPPPSPPPPAPPAGAPPPIPPTERRAPRARWPWVAVVAALVLVLVLVLAALRLTGDDDPPEATSPTSEPTGPRDEGATGDVARDASVTVPETAPPNQDVAGNPTTYVGANLLDGVPETCWRMPGDGTGAEITVTLARETRLTEVGMVNGYAKTAEDGRGRELDWYHGNRRVLAVEWEFDDGSTVAQELGDTTEVQTVEVDVRTTTVVLRLVSVSEPGTGPAARDYTAISDLALVAGP